MTQQQWPTLPARGFEESEFINRLSKLQAGMKRDNLDAIFLTTEQEIRYFSGFFSQFWQSPTRPWFLVIPASGKPIAIIPEIGRAAMSTTWIEDIRTWSSPAPEDEGISLLSETLSEVIGPFGTLGVMLGAESHVRMPATDFELLKENIMSLTLHDCNDLIRSLRSVKSEAEIQKIRHAAQCASHAFQNVPNFVSQGMSDLEVFKAFKIECLKAGVDDVSYLVGAAQSGGYDDIISPPNGKILSEGDVLILDTGCVWDGYFCDFDRNYSIGKPNQNVIDAHHLVWDATQEALEICKPGITCADLFWKMNKSLGLSNETGSVGRLGHGLGMQLTEHPSHAAFDQTELVEGMVLTLEPGLEFEPGKMMVHEENIVIRKNGAELLSVRADRDIVQI